MSEPSDPVPVEPGGLRVGHAERAAALRALDEHFAAGRLDVTEFGDRSAAAGAAVCRREIDALFADLPAPHPDPPALPAAAGPAPAPARREPRVPNVLLGLLPVLVGLALVLVVAVAHNPAGFALFPLVFLIAGRFGPHRRP